MAGLPRRGGHLKKETEAMVHAAKDQALQVNSIKHHIDGQDISPMCTLCDEMSETVMHINNGFPVLAASKCQVWHDRVGNHIYLLLLKKCVTLAGNEWYKHVPDAVPKREGQVTIYWDQPLK